MSLFAVRGSFVRKCLFWIHLGSGVSAGLIIFVVSATGIALAYESQISASAAARNRIIDTARPRQSAEVLAQIVRRARPGALGFNLEFSADPAVPVTASSGREFGAGARFSLPLNPYTGEIITDAAASTRQFFRVVENWHRWLGASPGGVGASAVDLANLLFLFMTVTGLYLWFPDGLRWRTLRGLMLFRSRYVNAKVRDFSWHHVLGFWALVPLFLIAFSGVVMSYGWANGLLFAAFGETAPVRQGPGADQRGPVGQGTSGSARSQVDGHHRRDHVAGVDGPGHSFGPARNSPTSGYGMDGTAKASLDQLLSAAQSNQPSWQRLTLPVNNELRRLNVIVEVPSTGHRPQRRTIVLDASDASLISVSDVGGFGTTGTRQQSAAQQLRGWLRFTHTGEQFGIIGQTIAALASLAACLLAYTGLALSFRRLILPLFRRHGSPMNEPAASPRS